MLFLKKLHKISIRTGSITRLCSRPKQCAGQCALKIRLGRSDYTGCHLLRHARVELAAGVGIRVPGGIYSGLVSSFDE